jgi:NADPH2:quinone reductase
MKAAYIEQFAPKNNVIVGELPAPEPGDGEVSIAVAYAGVNPVDSKIAQGHLQGRIPHQFPLILGWEACGTIHSLGKGVNSFKVGDKVYLYCRKPTVQWGAWAEYLAYPAKEIALAPKTLSMAESAGVPLAGLTAWQGLFDKLKLQPNETVIIHGGAGGVVGFAIQWAKIRGAHVISTASESKFDYVKELGADKVIDYKKTPFVEEILRNHPGGIDAVYDTIGGETYRLSFSTLKPKGRIVSILEPTDSYLCQKHDVEAHYLFVEPNGKQLKEMAALFDNKRAKPPAIRQLPLDQAQKAIDEIKGGHTKGKIILEINS